MVVRERSCLPVTRHRYALIAGGGPPELEARCLREASTQAQTIETSQATIEVMP